MSRKLMTEFSRKWWTKSEFDKSLTKLRTTGTIIELMMLSHKLGGWICWLTITIYSSFRFRFRFCYEFNSGANIYSILLHQQQRQHMACVCDSLIFSGYKCWVRVGLHHSRASCVRESSCNVNTSAACSTAAPRTNLYRLCCQWARPTNSVLKASQRCRCVIRENWSLFYALQSFTNIARRNAAAASLASVTLDILTSRSLTHTLLAIKFFFSLRPILQFTHWLASSMTWHVCEL